MENTYQEYGSKELEEFSYFMVLIHGKRGKKTWAGAHCTKKSAVWAAERLHKLEPKLYHEVIECRPCGSIMNDDF